MAEKCPSQGRPAGDSVSSPTLFSLLALALSHPCSCSQTLLAGASCHPSGKALAWLQRDVARLMQLVRAASGARTRVQSLPKSHSIPLGSVRACVRVGGGPESRPITSGACLCGQAPRISAGWGGGQQDHPSLLFLRCTSGSWKVQFLFNPRASVYFQAGSAG